MNKTRMTILVLLLFGAFFSSNSTTAAVWEEDIIGIGKGWETEVYIYDTKKEGPSVLLVGGVHGDEPAGALAIKELLPELTIDIGKLVVVPEANKQALELDLRYPPGAEDLNRAFVEKEPESWTEKLAKEIYQLIEKHNIDFVFDLHEARDYYRINPDSVGQTIIFNGQGEEIFLAWDIADKINPLLFPIERFIILSPTARDSLTRRAHEELGLTTFIIETTRKQDLDVRIKQQKMVVLSALKLLGLKEDLKLEDLDLFRSH